MTAKVPIGELQDVGDMIWVMAREHSRDDVSVHRYRLHMAPRQPELAKQLIPAAHDARRTECYDGQQR